MYIIGGLNSLQRGGNY